VTQSPQIQKRCSKYPAVKPSAKEFLPRFRMLFSYPPDSRIVGLTQAHSQRDQLACPRFRTEGP